MYHSTLSLLSGFDTELKPLTSHSFGQLSDAERMDMRNNVIRAIVDILVETPRPFKVEFEGGIQHRPLSYPRSEADQMPELLMPSGGGGGGGCGCGG